MSLKQLEAVRSEFVAYMSAHDMDDLPDGAWWQVLEDAATTFLEEHKIKYDSNSATHKFLIWRSDAFKC